MENSFANLAGGMENPGGVGMGAGVAVPKITVLRVKGNPDITYVYVDPSILPEMTVEGVRALRWQVEQGMGEVQPRDDDVPGTRSAMEKFMDRVFYNVSGINGVYNRTRFFETTHAIWSTKSICGKRTRRVTLARTLEHPESLLLADAWLTGKGLAPEVIPFKPFEKPLVLVLAGQVGRFETGLEYYSQAVVLRLFEGVPTAFVKDSRKDGKCGEKLFDLLEDLDIERAIIYSSAKDDSTAVKSAFNIVAEVLNGTPKGRFWENQTDSSQPKLFSRSARRQVPNWGWDTVFKSE